MAFRVHALAASVVLSGLFLDACPAQSNYTFLPPDWTGVDVPSRMLGHYAQGRVQLFDSGLRHNDALGGQKCAALVQVEYRGLLYLSPKDGSARSWTKVRLTLGECDVSKAGLDFEKNYISINRVTVYDAKTSWPALTTTGAWGEHVSFPFTRQYMQQGKDLLLDYEFFGGKLANGTTWPAKGVNYGLYAVTDDSAYWYNIAGKPVPTTVPNCGDSANTQRAECQLSVRVYGEHYVPSLAERFYATDASARGLAANAPAIAAICVDGSTTGVGVGAKCNLLHVNLAASLPLLTVTANADGVVPAFVNTTGSATLPYKDTWANTEAWMQVAWTDSKTTQLGLTAASRLTLPHNPYYFQHKKGIWEAWTSTGVTVKWGPGLEPRLYTRVKWK